MKKLTNDELQFVFGGDGESQNKCDDLQRQLNEYEETDSAHDEEFYLWWAIAFENCANGNG
ncbi:MAG: hypothetical protein K2K27_05020 [Muribaculaceae bacterium]|nr:hypothetical protein [Muribaculaceae bacterium]MDE6643444.1 hypothetical protein [Muribaculaceae bacterium]